MKSQRYGVQRTRVLVAIVAIVVVVGGIRYCTMSSVVAPGVVRGLDRYPGVDTAATRKYVNNVISFDPNHPHQLIVDTIVDGVHLRITPEKKAHKVSWSDALSAGPGYIVALIENKDTVPYPDLNLAANDSAYVWVGEIAGGSRRVAYYKINRVDGTAIGLKRASKAGWCSQGETHGDTAAVHLHPMPQCQGQAGSHSFYAFAGETDQLATQPLNASPYRLASNAGNSEVMVAALLLHTQGLWISCSSGCCEASGTDVY